MKKNQQFNSKATYESPACKTIVLLSRNLCQVTSPYGVAGRAGARGSFINETNEDDDY